jgi:hypothetical protein
VFGFHALNGWVARFGQRAIKPGELVVIATPTVMDAKQPEFIHLL